MSYCIIKILKHFIINLFSLFLWWATSLVYYILGDDLNHHYGGVARYQDSTGKYGHLSSEGHILTEAIYTEVTIFDSNKAHVKPKTALNMISIAMVGKSTINFDSEVNASLAEVVLLFSYTFPTTWACSGLSPARARPWRANETCAAGAHKTQARSSLISVWVSSYYNIINFAIVWINRFLSFPKEIFVLFIASINIDITVSNRSSGNFR